MKTSTHIMGWRIAGALLIVGLLSGCAGLRPYPSSMDKNLHIQTETDSGTIFSKVRAAVDIFSVNADCTPEYQGTVKLKAPSIDVGILPDELSYMVFVFSNSSFLANSRSSISHETLLKTRAGYNYDIKVSYIDDIYDVSIEESHQGSSKSREIGLRNLSTCQSL